MKKISLLGALSLNTSIPTPLMANTLNSSKNNIENNSTTYRRWPQKEDPPFRSPQEIDCKNERQLIAFVTCSWWF